MARREGSDRGSGKRADGREKRVGGGALGDGPRRECNAGSASGEGGYTASKSSGETAPNT